MGTDLSGSAGSLARSRLRLIGRLRLGLPEALEAVLAYMDSCAPAVTTQLVAQQQAQYLSARREVVGACLEWGLLAIEGGERQAGPVPPIVLAGVRRAVKDGVELATALDRCRGAYEVVWDFTLQELAATEADEPDWAIVLGEVSAAATTLFARLVIGVVGVYGGEPGRSGRSASQGNAEIVSEPLASDGLVEFASAELDDEIGRV